MIDQEISGQSGNPDLETAAAAIEAAQVPVNLEKHVLGQVFGILRVTRKPVAQAVDAAMMCSNQLGPCNRIPTETASYNDIPIGFQASFPTTLMESLICGSLPRHACDFLAFSNWQASGAQCLPASGSMGTALLFRRSQSAPAHDCFRSAGSTAFLAAATTGAVRKLHPQRVPRHCGRNAHICQIRHICPRGSRQRQLSLN